MKNKSKIIMILICLGLSVFCIQKSDIYAEQQQFVSSHTIYVSSYGKIEMSFWYNKDMSTGKKHLENGHIIERSLITEILFIM